ncbi:Hypothetical predicted protein [Cloeon dipterum]|uniref:Uncharacterized protein n=1 Tax=Cloeon dipterum TaxID=197152 RepID=A0A8S1CY80_9INSE|nr:Hypothetical predicted protein [Cloeon dipterum]
MESEEEPLVSDSDPAESEAEAAAPPALAAARNHLVVCGAAMAASGTALVVALPMAAAPASAHLPCPFLLATVATAACLCGLALGLPRKGLRRGSLGSVARAGAFQGAAAAAVALAVQPGRLLCHLQVPLMGVGLAFALAFCFLVCRKVVSLRRLLSGLLVILGVFVSVDLQLCNEFRCLGNQVTPPKKSAWLSNGGHLFWAAVYVLAIGLWAFSCALLENFFLLTKAKPSSLLVSTVETWTAAPDLLPRGAPEEAPWRASVDVAAALATAQLAALVLFAIVSALAAVLLKDMSTWYWLLSLCWCLWQEATCNWSGWILSASYAPFLYTTCHFLRTSESALFTTATAALALPVSGIWWSLFRADEQGHLEASPSLSGDLISALLGLPVVCAGLVLFVRLHMAELRKRVL